MTHWLLDSIEDLRIKSLKQAGELLLLKEFDDSQGSFDFNFIERNAKALEMAALDLILNRFEDDDEKLINMRTCSADAFRLYRVLPRKTDPIKDGTQILKMCSLAIMGDMGTDASRYLKEYPWPKIDINSTDWYDRTWAVIIDVWLRLIRKKGWDDRDRVLENIVKLRESQNEFEGQYLNKLDHNNAKISAIKLICLYHLAKTAEILALFITDGAVEGNHQVHQLLDTHFDRIFSICNTVQLLEIEPLTRILSVCAHQMIEK